MSVADWSQDISFGSSRPLKHTLLVLWHDMLFYLPFCERGRCECFKFLVLVVSEVVPPGLVFGFVQSIYQVYGVGPYWFCYLSWLK